MRAGVGLTADPRYLLALAQVLASCAYYCIIYTVLYNDAGQVVGWAMDAMGNFTALVWQNKVPVDLNTLIPAGSPWYLQNARSINDAGEIAGQGLLNGQIHAFLATPK